MHAVEPLWLRSTTRKATVDADSALHGRQVCGPHTQPSSTYIMGCPFQSFQLPSVAGSPSVCAGVLLPCSSPAVLFGAGPSQCTMHVLRGPKGLC